MGVIVIGVFQPGRKSLGLGKHDRVKLIHSCGDRTNREPHNNVVRQVRQPAELQSVVYGTGLGGVRFQLTQVAKQAITRQAGR